MSLESPSSRSCFLSIMVALMVLASAAPAGAYHNEEVQPARAYYLAGFATHGAGVIPDFQGNIGVCQKLSWETVHEPIGIGGACHLPLNAGDNVIWVYDDTGFGLGTGNVHHQWGFWFRCVYFDEEGTLATGEWLYTEDYVTRFGGSTPFFYAEIAWAQKCQMVDVVVPISASVGEITVTDPCRDFTAREEPCVGISGYWSDVDDLVNLVVGLYDQARKLVLWILRIILRLVPSGLGGDYLSIPMPPQNPLSSDPNPKVHLPGENQPSIDDV